MMKIIMGDKSHAVAASTAHGALKIAGAYVLLGLSYFVALGLIVRVFESDPQDVALLGKMKGAGFVAVTGALLYLLVNGHEKRRDRAEMLLRQNDRREIVALCNATVAHDIKNLLMVLAGLVEALKGKEQGDDFIITMRNEVERSISKLAELSRSLLRSERERSLEHCDVLKQVANAVRLLRGHPDVKKCRLKENNIASASLNMDVALFEQALMNLVINAAQAAGEGGEIEIGSRLLDGAAVLEVHDNGPGIPTDEASRIFESGYTTKADGSGLGMLSVRAFAASCNGEVSIGRSHLGGAVVRIRIPIPGETSNQASGDTARKFDDTLSPPPDRWTLST